MKTKIKNLIIILLLFSVLFIIPVKVDAAGPVKKGDKVTKNVTAKTDAINQELWTGITLERMGIDTLRLGSVASTDENLVYSWDYNAVIAANMPAIKIASWGMPAKIGYKQGTTAQIAKNYESTHPGYMVIAAINGDFFANTSYKSSNGANNNPTFDPINTWVADGGYTFKKPTVAHPHHNVIGLNLDRTYTYHLGSIYDANGNPTPLAMGGSYVDTNGNIITSHSLPNAGYNLPDFTETPIFTIDDYKVAAEITSTNFSDTGVNIVIAGTNINVEGFTTIKVYMDRYSRPNDGFQGKYWYGESITGHQYDIDYTGIYINGRTFEPETLSKIESVPSGYCYIVTKDQEVINRVEKNKNVLCQYELEGEIWGNCNSTIGTVLPYILKGERTQYVAKADNYLNDAKPKAIVAFTESNECIFMLVGPGELSGSTNTIKGPSSIEVAELLERVNAYDAFALDGGGSATICVRNQEGQFVTLNKTTDGTDRSIGNALLMIVEKPNLTLESKTSTTLSFYQEKPMAESELVEASVVINNKEYPLVDGKVTVENLTKNTSYDYHFKYKFQNKLGTFEMTTYTQTAKTLEKDIAKPSNFKVDITKQKDGTITLNITCTANETEFVSACILDGNYELIDINSLNLTLPDETILDIDEEDLGILYKYSFDGDEYEIKILPNEVAYSFTDLSEEEPVNPDPVNPDPVNPEPSEPVTPSENKKSCKSCKKSGLVALSLLSFASIALLVFRKKH